MAFIPGPERPKGSRYVTQDQFDFELNSRSQGVDFSLSPVKIRTTMLNRVTRNKNESAPHTTTKLDRDSIDKRLQATKAEDNWNGVAYGSPTHPPPSLPALPDTNYSFPSRSLFSSAGPLPSYPPAAIKLGKLSNLFRPRLHPMTISAPTSVHKLDGDQKLGMPIARKPLPETHTLPIWVNSEDPAAYSFAQLDSANLHLHDSMTATSARTRRTSLPRLEIQIPHVEMDRYSIMFSDVSGIKPSSLLERRSRNLSRVTSLSDESIPPVPLLSSLQPHRSTTPDCQRPDQTRNFSCTSATPLDNSSETLREQPFDPEASVSKYLIEDGPALLTQIAGNNVLRECVTSERQGLSASHLSPADTIVSSETHDSPWRYSESLPSAPSSRTLIGSEIFFNVTPARDSNGKEQSHFIIHRPESSIELALSHSRRSRKVMVKRRDGSSSCSSSQPDLRHTDKSASAGGKSTPSLELDEAIPEVEKLALPLNTRIEQPNSSAALGVCRPSEVLDLVPPVRIGEKLEGHAIGIPSPINERSEEISPRQTPIPLTAASQLHYRPHIATLSTQAPLSDISFNCQHHFLDYSIMSTPVPIKDANFIPMSKFAAVGTADKLVEHHSRRRKSKRAVTDSRVLRSNPTRLGSSSRTTREHDYAAHTLPQTMYSASKTCTVQNVEAGIAAIAVKPAAEISVARRVLLSRKQSQKIEISSRKSRAVETIDDITLSPMGGALPSRLGGYSGHKPVASISMVVVEEVEVA